MPISPEHLEVDDLIRDSLKLAEDAVNRYTLLARLVVVLDEALRAELDADEYERVSRAVERRVRAAAMNGN